MDKLPRSADLDRAFAKKSTKYSSRSYLEDRLLRIRCDRRSNSDDDYDRSIGLIPLMTCRVQHRAAGGCSNMGLTILDVSKMVIV